MASRLRRPFYRGARDDGCDVRSNAVFAYLYWFIDVPFHFLYLQSFEQDRKRPDQAANNIGRVPSVCPDTRYLCQTRDILVMMEVVLSFDTTLSMFDTIDHIRETAEELIKPIFKDIPNVRMAVIAHGDYFDKNRTYVIKVEDFSSDSDRLSDFVRTMDDTSGGDWPECYELVLRHVRKKLSWTKENKHRILIMIGDAIPHEPGNKENQGHIDWRRELAALSGAGVHVYGIQMLADKDAGFFWRHLGATTLGKHIQLGKFHTLVDTAVRAICLRETGEKEIRLKKLEEHVNTQKKMSRRQADVMRRMFDNLLKEDSKSAMTRIPMRHPSRSYSPPSPPPSSPTPSSHRPSSHRPSSHRPSSHRPSFLRPSLPKPSISKPSTASARSNVLTKPASQPVQAMAETASVKATSAVTMGMEASARPPVDAQTSMDQGTPDQTRPSVDRHPSTEQTRPEPARPSVDRRPTAQQSTQGRTRQSVRSELRQFVGLPLEVVVTLDTTESKASLLAIIQSTMATVAERLFGDLPQLRLAVLAHGDYDTQPYVTQQLDFTKNTNEVAQFVSSLPIAKGGASWQECYELVLRKVRESLAWTPGSQRAIIMVGDSAPHQQHYPLNTQHIDWKSELAILRSDMDVRVYGLQLFADGGADQFWSYLAKATGGKHIDIGQFESLVTTAIMAVCYKEAGAEQLMDFTTEVLARENQMNPDEYEMACQVFDALTVHSTFQNYSRTAVPVTAEQHIYLTTTKSVILDQVVEVVIAIDTTATMYGTVEYLRSTVHDVMNELYHKFVGLRIAMILHGNFNKMQRCETTLVDFSTDPQILIDFLHGIKHTPPASDLPWQECYEVLLRQIRVQLSWTPESRGALIMIGDSHPRGPVCKGGINCIDWKEEVRLIKAMGVHIYAVQIFSADETDDFWLHLAAHSGGGKHLQLGDMGELLDSVIVAICCKECSPQQFEECVGEMMAKAEKSKHSAGVQSVLSQLSGYSAHSLHHVPDPKSHSVGDQGSRRCTKYYVEKKIRREEVVPRFLLRFSVEWSLWFVAMMIDTLNVNLKVWKPRPDRRVGFHNVSIFDGDFSQPAVYEIAVTTPNMSTKYVTYSYTCNGSSATVWDDVPLGDDRLLDQLDCVVARGCKVHLRRMLVTEPVMCNDKVCKTPSDNPEKTSAQSPLEASSSLTTTCRVKSSCHMSSAETVFTVRKYRHV
ncbi:hypothetical protein LSAT2_022918 [Lamellibrachia satsuma]|nr:hypothetical protein LSAT2_022918 [Lamellibrachia satsuma]